MPPLILGEATQLSSLLLSEVERLRFNPQVICLITSEYIKSRIPKMATDSITLKISTPSAIFRNEEVYRVVIPAAHGNLTILKGRAPTSIFFNRGLILVLDRNDKYIEKYFTKEGVADIKDNICHISTEDIIPFNEITLQQAQEKLASSKHQDSIKFYRMVINVLSNKV